MKKIITPILLLSVLGAGCKPDYRRDKSGLPESLRGERIIGEVLAARGSGEDPGLFLYGEEATRNLVIDFYTNLTGNEDIALAILRHAAANIIPLPLAFSLAWAESTFNPKAFNRNTGSVDRGLFQLNSKTFSALKVEDFYNPDTNAEYGLAHLRFCLNEGGDEIIALAIYNAGTYGVKSGTPYSTLKYVAKVMDYKEDLENSFWELLESSCRIARSAEAPDSPRGNDDSFSMN